MKVCIDAGHSKATLGKRSFDGTLLEYEFNRSVARKLKAILERHGVDCIYSCDLNIETDVSLSTRANTANLAKADLFISIHANAYGTEWNDVTGWEIYVCKKGGKAEMLANAIHDASIPYLGLKDRGVKEANFTVLTKTDMPAVLVEHGFYTNKLERALLATDSFREKCAIADARGILSYLGIKWNDTMPLEKASSWAEESWSKAVQKGVFDGTNPQGTVTREMLSVILDRLKLL